MGGQKKTGKGRLDKYYHYAKEQGYRARSAFKLIQLNKKYDFLSGARCLIDLCAAPGGWLQVATKYMPMESLIVGVDLCAIKPIHNCITFQEDITTEKCRSQLRATLKTFKADVVLHDGAPNVGSAWIQDAYTQSELVLKSFALAVEFLNKGGTFVTKVFRSKDYNNLIWIFNQLFTKVEATKPPSSRNVSAEIFVVCRDFLAPKKIDPKFLDPRYVFKDLENDLATKSASSLNIFEVTKKTRHRDGYEDGNYTQNKVVDIQKFIEAEDPIGFLVGLNSLSFESEFGKPLFNDPITTEDIKDTCKDLKVLGKKDFKELLKWRTKMIKKLNPEDENKDEEKVETVEEIDIAEELEKLAEQARTQERKKKRKTREKKSKEMVKLQLNMVTPTDIGMDQNESEFHPDSMVQSKRLATALSGNMDTEDGMRSDEEEEVEEEEEVDSEGELDRLGDSLDAMYEHYQTRMNDRKQHLRENMKKYEEWHGFDEEATGHDVDTDDSDDAGGYPNKNVIEDSDSDSDSDIDSNEKPANQLSSSASMFFNNPIFNSLDNKLADTNANSKKRKLEKTKKSAKFRDRMKALDARPIKKIAEAKARKKLKAAQRLAKLTKKASQIADSEDMTEKEKASSIEKLMSKKAKPTKKSKVKLVVARGGNRGVKGRPNGVKGRYKMVDPRMRKEIRAEKRQAAKSKKKRR
ncbi:FtsJ-domain-containing protein [Conidiobolus coronatus NRRL 28638]|uniref:FtsJ-domain-containing protein n=1 Tax=Conidiobolus coronatus (strain ATCC 28846 / CBS 209.66 / NRRL 28638) TaxID=796925 RepID=A0A137PAV8_CONC2|nr:FtsJ-domain-containing protein [Conidiobolus coronatus NRRL 28638]|eukprot:KXN72143.1 FtsJ-domain-containing protein [Conidiobolus coronatus NRRL 28638]